MNYRNGIYSGIVEARTVNVPAPGNTHTFSVRVHFPDHTELFTNVRPWVLDFTTDNLHTRPYPLSAIVDCHVIEGAVHFVFPNQSPATGVCP